MTTLFLKNKPIDNLIIPEHIEHISIIQCELNIFPELPINIKSITFTQTKLTNIPSLSKYTKLKYITLKDNYITTTNYDLPDSLITIDLSFNMLTDYYSNTPTNLTFLDLSFNHLEKPPTLINKQFVIIELNHAFNSTKCDHLNIYNNHGFQRFICNINNTTNTNTNNNNNNNTNTNNINNTNSLYNNNQNVHDTTIQKDVLKSIEYIMNYKNYIPYNTNYYEELSKIFKKKWYKRLFSRKYESIKYNLDEFISKHNTHSVLNVSYNEVLERVWLFIQNSEHKKELIKILKEQIKESIGLCFTGKISRLISVLDGYCDEIHIGISVNEQINNKAYLLYNQYSDNIQKYNEEIITLLQNEYPEISIHERQQWIMEEII